MKIGKVDDNATLPPALQRSIAASLFPAINAIPKIWQLWESYSRAADFLNHLICLGVFHRSLTRGIAQLAASSHGTTQTWAA